MSPARRRAGRGVRRAGPARRASTGLALYESSRSVAPARVRLCAGAARRPGPPGPRRSRPPSPGSTPQAAARAARTVCTPGVGIRNSAPRREARSSRARSRTAKRTPARPSPTTRVARRSFATRGRRSGVTPGRRGHGETRGSSREHRDAPAGSAASSSLAAAMRSMVPRRSRCTAPRSSPRPPWAGRSRRARRSPRGVHAHLEHRVAVRGAQAGRVSGKPSRCCGSRPSGASPRPGPGRRPPPPWSSSCPPSPSRRQP